MEMLQHCSKTITLLLFLWLCSNVFALAPARTLYQYPKGTWIENLAVRRNGSLLLTSLTIPGNVHSINPFDGSAPLQVAAPPGFSSTLGIAETTPDTFYFIASNFSFFAPTPPYLNTLWRMEFKDGAAMPALTKVGEFRDAKLLNGLTKFNDTLLLAADSMAGTLWILSTETGEASILAEDPLMIGSKGNGINGVRFRDGSLFFTNYDQGTFNQLRLDHNAQPQGSVTVIGTSLPEDGVLPQFDDFALARSGDAYIATEAGNGIQKVTAHGNVSIVAGNVNSTAIAQSTAAEFGRTQKDRDVLYVTTAGGLGIPVIVNGSQTTVGAQIVAVDFSRC